MENKKVGLLLLLVLTLPLIGLVIYLYPVSNGWNNYWSERFDDGQCEEICKENDMNLVMQNPSTCGCKNYEMNLQINFRRPQSFRDTIAWIFA